MRAILLIWVASSVVFALVLARVLANPTNPTKTPTPPAATRTPANRR